MQQNPATKLKKNLKLFQTQKGVTTITTNDFMGLLHP